MSNSLHRLLSQLSAIFFCGHEFQVARDQNSCLYHQLKYFLTKQLHYFALAPEGANLVPLFIRFMTPVGAIWSRDHRTVTMR